MLDILWGLKTHALFDIWSFEHLLSGVSIGHLVCQCNNSVVSKLFWKQRYSNRMYYFDIIGVLFLAYLWETTEIYLEMGVVGEAVQYWFHGIEFWANRIICDPIVTLAGYLISKWSIKTVLASRLFIIVFLFIHIFIFPHSMYLQELL